MSSRRDEIDAEIARLRREQRALQPKPGGRKAKPDGMRLYRMAVLLLRHEVENPWQAAGRVAEADPGPDPVVTTRKRIYDKYRPRREQIERAAARNLELEAVAAAARAAAPPDFGRALAHLHRQQVETFTRIVAIAEAVTGPAGQLRVALERWTANYERMLKRIAGN